MKNVKIETLTKRKAINAFEDRDPKNIIKELKQRHQKASDLELETLKMLYVFEVSELWMGLGRYHSSGNYSAFEKLLQDESSWVRSITLYRRFKLAVQDLGEMVIKKIGLDAINNLYRIEDEKKRAEVLDRMVAQAERVGAPLSNASARLYVNGNTPRTRNVSDTELRDENRHLKTRAEMLSEQLEQANAAIAKLERENAKLMRENVRLREQLSAVKRPAAKTQRKTGKRKVGRGSHSRKAA